MQPHEILGVPPDATAAQVRAAYRRAAQTTHPDHGGTPDAFRAVHEAYRTLQAHPSPTDPPAAGNRPAASVAVPDRPPGAWRRALDTRVVQAATTAVYAALTVAGRGSALAAVAGLWAVLVLAPPAGLLWAVTAAGCAWRHRHTPRPPRPPAGWRRRLRSAGLLAVGLPVAWVSVAVCCWTLLQAVHAARFLVAWLSS